ncbi:hypothetical protein Dimus_039354 [Dionaea muscipula]
MSKRRQKSKRVTWAPDANLSQVKLFLPEDCPSQVGIDSNDHLQAKTSSIEYDDVPPGFEGNLVSNAFKKEHPIPQVNWKCAPKFVLNRDWYVAAGEQSEERMTQPQREIRVLEAIYPRPSAIPPSPCVPLEVELCDYDDGRTPAIPIIPIEEDDAIDLTQDSAQPIATETAPEVDCPALEEPPCDKKPPLGMLASLDADIIAAASAAFTALMKSNEQGSMIDTDLLIKILSDPKMIELLKDVGSFNRVNTTCGTLTPDAASSAAITAVGKNNELGSMIDTDLLIKILSDPKLIEVLKDVSSYDRFKTNPGLPAKLMPLSCLKQAIPDVTTVVQKTTQPASSTLAMPVPVPVPVLERAPSIPLSRMEPPHTKQAIEKRNGLPMIVSKKPDNPDNTRSILSEKPATENLGIPLKTLQMMPHTHRRTTMTVSAADTDRLPSSCEPFNPTWTPNYVSKPAEPIGTMEPALTTMPGNGYVVPKVNLALAVCNLTASLDPMSAMGPDAISSRPTNGFTQASHHSEWHGSYSSPLLPNMVQVPTVKVKAAKDPDYYKNLIKQHGIERQETRKGHGGIQQKNDHPNLKPKSRKLCIYFNSSRGCRNGSNCPYLHDSSVLLQTGSVEEAKSFKRIKPTREITGTT